MLISGGKQSLAVRSFFPGMPLDTYNNVADKTEVSKRLVPGERTLVLISIGQSMSATHSTETYARISSRVHNYNFQSGGMYDAANPMLGHSIEAPGTSPGPFGSTDLRTADKIISTTAIDRVILVPSCIGGAHTNFFKIGGIAGDRIPVICKRLIADGLVPPAVDLFIQIQIGETDSALNVPQAETTANLLSVIQNFRDNGITAKAFVAKCSWYLGALTVNSPNTRAAQAAVVNGVDVFQGPDTDILGNAHRDATQTHWNSFGSDACSTLWTNVYSPHIT